VRVLDEAGYGASVQTLLTQSCAPGHWMHAAVQFAPVVFVSATQALPHMWKPALQV
jgi:hypothetical protein